MFGSLINLLDNTLNKYNITYTFVGPCSVLVHVFKSFKVIFPDKLINESWISLRQNSKASLKQFNEQ